MASELMTNIYEHLDRAALLAELGPRLRGQVYELTCPQCGNTDQSKMNVARRTCGYIGTQYWNQGRTQEIRDRVLHL